MRSLLLSIIVMAGSRSLTAQWQVALLHGSATSHGDARAEADPDHPELHAEGPSTWLLAFARDVGAWRIGADLHRTTADLAEVGGSSSVTTRSVLAAWGAGIEVGRRIAGHAGAATLQASAGVRVDRWTFDLVETAPRTRVAAQGALSAQLPIGVQWSAVIRGEVTHGPSVFIAEELPEGFSSRTATRLGMVLGVARRF